MEMSETPPYFDVPPDSSESPVNTQSLTAGDAEEEDAQMSDASLQEAITCPVCLRVYDEPKLLHCGHSLCAPCIVGLRLLDADGRHGYYVCPVCRTESDEPLAVNYALRDVVYQLKEKEAMVKQCFECGKAAKPEEQYSCNDCDRNTQQEQLRCGLCAMNKHAKIGHAVSKYEQKKEYIKSVMNEIENMAQQAKHLTGECKRAMENGHQSAKDSLRVLEHYQTQFTAVQETLASNEYLTRNDIEVRLTYARQLRDFLMQRASNFINVMQEATNRIKAVTQGTNVEPVENEMADDGRDETATAALFSGNNIEPRSWFEYQPQARVNYLQSTVARRNAAIARRHNATATNSDSEMERMTSGVQGTLRNVPVVPAVPTVHFVPAVPTIHYVPITR